MAAADAANAIATADASAAAAAPLTCHLDCSPRVMQGTTLVPLSSSSKGQHALVGVVAVSTAALCLAEGGYAPGAYAAAGLVAWVGVIAMIVATRDTVDVPGAALVSGAALAGLAAFALLSVAWGSDDGRAVAEAIRPAAYAGVFALVVIASRRGQAFPFLAGLGIGLAVVAALALGSRFESSLPGSDEELGAILPAAVGRLSYPLGYWNALAACMAIGVVLLGWLGAAARTQPARALAVGAIPLCMLAIYLASSRGGVLAAAVGIVVLLLAGREWRERPRRLRDRRGRSRVPRLSSPAAATSCWTGYRAAPPSRRARRCSWPPCSCSPRAPVPDGCSTGP